MEKQEYLLKLAMFEQEINALGQQLQVIEQQTLEMQNLQLGLQELKESKEKQMFANLGKNIFIKTEIKDKNLLVDVGNKVFVKKSIDETLKVAEEQLGKLMETRDKLIDRMQEIQKQTEKVIAEVEESKK